MYILNEQSRSSDKGWSSGLELVEVLTQPSPINVTYYKSKHKVSEFDRSDTIYIVCKSIF